MKDYEKVVKVNDNRILRYNISNGFVPIDAIREDFFKDGKLIKNYKLCRWDDYGFTGWIKMDYDKYIKNDSLTYEFNIDHPMFFPLLHLLQNNEYLVIDDDETQELDKKYMIFNKDNNKIKLTFINTLEDDKTFKERLYYFFKEVLERINEEYHQITLEEYLVYKYQTIDNDELKKYVRKRNIL